MREARGSSADQFHQSLEYNPSQQFQLPVVSHLMSSHQNDEINKQAQIQIFNHTLACSFRIETTPTL